MIQLSSPVCLHQVANYPFDASSRKQSGSVYSASPDDDVFKHVSEVYSSAHATMHTGDPCPKMSREHFDVRFYLKICDVRMCWIARAAPRPTTLSRSWLPSPCNVVVFPSCRVSVSLAPWLVNNADKFLDWCIWFCFAVGLRLHWGLV